MGRCPRPDCLLALGAGVFPVVLRSSRRTSPEAPVPPNKMLVRACLFECSLERSAALLMVRLGGFSTQRPWSAPLPRPSFLSPARNDKPAGRALSATKLLGAVHALPACIHRQSRAWARVARQGADLALPAVLAVLDQEHGGGRAMTERALHHLRCIAQRRLVVQRHTFRH